MEKQNRHTDTIKQFVDLELNAFYGIKPGTVKSHVIEAVGQVYKEGPGLSILSLWMSVHVFKPLVRITAWYQLEEEQNSIPDHQAVIWLERPITPDEVKELRAWPNGIHPGGVPHLLAWPDRGLCLYFSRKSRLPTLLFGFEAMTEAEFDQSLIVASYT